MISVKVSGGLGNQMFQYAIGRKLAEKNKTQLKLDISALLNSLPKKDFTFREFGLGAFQAKYKLNICSRLALLTGLKNIFFIINKVGLIFRNKIRPVITEKGQFNLEEKVLDLKNGSYLDGYWQNEKYFLENRDKVPEELRDRHYYNFRGSKNQHGGYGIFLLHWSGFELKRYDPGEKKWDEHDSVFLFER